MSERISSSRSNALLKKLRKMFIIKTYIVFVLFVLLSVIEWYLFSLELIGNFIYSHIELCIASLFVALIIMIVFVFVENVRFASALNWLLTLVIVECVIVALGPIIAITCNDVAFLSIFAALVPIIIFALIGSFIPHDLTLDVIVLFVLSFIFFVGALYFIIVFVVTELLFSIYVFSGLIYFLVCIFIMYHAQTINGNRYAEMRLTDYLLAALILYVDFIVLFMVATYVMAKIYQSIYDIRCNKFEIEYKC